MRKEGNVSITEPHLVGDLVSRRIIYSRCKTYLEIMEPFLHEVPDLRVGRRDVVGLGLRELLLTYPRSPSCSTSSGPGPRASSAAAGMPGRDAMDKARG